VQGGKGKAKCRGVSAGGGRRSSIMCISNADKSDVLTFEDSWGS